MCLVDGAAGQGRRSRLPRLLTICFLLRAEISMIADRSAQRVSCGTDSVQIRAQVLWAA